VPLQWTPSPFLGPMMQLDSVAPSWSRKTASASPPSACSEHVDARVQVLDSLSAQTDRMSALTVSVVQLHATVEALASPDSLNSPQSTSSGRSRQSSLQASVGRGRGTDDLCSCRSSAGKDGNEVMHCRVSECNVRTVYLEKLDDEKFQCEHSRSLYCKIYLEYSVLISLYECASSPLSHIAQVNQRMVNGTAVRLAHGFDTQSPHT